jgi:exopolysaccharide biosynthesis polyprenyl glycosylphosphotransferase
MSEKGTPSAVSDDQLANSATSELGGAAHGSVPGLSNVPAGIRRSQAMRNAAVVIPALAAAAASFVLGGLDANAAARAAVLGLAILATGLLLKGFSYPHRLMPVSRLLIALLPALVGGFVAGVIAISDAYNLAATGLLPATLIAVAVAVAIEMAGSKFLAARPLRVAVLGSPSFAAGLKLEVEAGSSEHVEVIGWLNVEGEAESGAAEMQIGTLDSIRAVITEHQVDLLVRGPAMGDVVVSRQTYQEIAEGCIDLPVRMIDGSQFYEQLFGHVPLGTIGSDWFLYLMHPSFEGASTASKRTFDLIGAVLTSIVALPLIAIAAIAIKIEDRGPVLYRQVRMGEGGRRYNILKLRTMREDAEGEGVQWSSSGDRRVTRVGRFLRRTHVDELPQLFNVFGGDMTLVGPRPERPEIIAELERLFPHYTRRHLVKPGVTGWAQVRCGYAGSELGTAWKLCHDLFYLKHRNMMADMLIMLETLAIAAMDAHRPLRAPQARFLWDQARADAAAESPTQGAAEERAIQGPGAGMQVPEIGVAGS